MVSEIQLDDAEIEAHLFAGALNLENQNRQAGRLISRLFLSFAHSSFSSSNKFDNEFIETRLLRSQSTAYEISTSAID